MKLTLVMLTLHATTATFEGLVQQRLPLRVVWFNETNCSGNSVGLGGPHYEAGKYSICVYPDAKIPHPEDTTVYGPGETECTEEQLTHFPYSCESYKGMYMNSAGPWSDTDQDATIEVRGADVFDFQFPERSGVPLPMPPSGGRPRNKEESPTSGNGAIVEIVPAPPHMFRVRVVRGWKGTLSPSGLPTTNGKRYDQYATIAVMPLEYGLKLYEGGQKYPTGGYTSYLLNQLLTDENTHRDTYGTHFGTEIAASHGVEGVINHRFRTTSKATRFPENVEYLGEGKVLELGDEFEVTPGQREDYLVPQLGRKYYAAETFGVPGPRFAGLLFNIKTESEWINDMSLLNSKVCADGRVQPLSIPCSDDCEGMKTYYETYCCEGSDAVNIDVEATSDEWCTHLRRMYKQECKCAA